MHQSINIKRTSQTSNNFARSANQLVAHLHVGTFADNFLCLAKKIQRSEPKPEL